MSRVFAHKGWVTGASALAMLGVSACGGGGGAGGGSGFNLSDPVIALSGTTGKYSQTPTEANASGGQLKPPAMPTGTNSANQFVRLEVPFKVLRKEIASDDSIFRVFSQLTGNMTVTDETGAHVPGIVVVNGIDAFGEFRGNDPGFPKDLSGASLDRNLGEGVIVYIADDGDGDLSTIAAFGGQSNDSDLNPLTTDITQIRISLGALYGRSIDAFYTVTVADGIAGDIIGPRVLSIVADQPDPADPLNSRKCASTARFIVRFSEPCIPTSVGKSAELDGTPFVGNMPLLTLPGQPPPKPLPNTHISATLNSNNSQLFLPCDVRPLNSNNLAAYVVTPLIDLPSLRDVTIVVVDSNANKDPTQTAFGALDLVGNLHTPGADVRQDFTAGRGRVPANAPVSPEAIYWLPVAANGIGVVDLNGMGFNTNTPGANAANVERAAIISRNANTFTSVAILGIGNRYDWPVGTGSFVYGPGFSIDGQTWVGNAPGDQGNPGTPIPGVNEMSSGFETLVRNAEGDVILSGAEGGTLGVVNDLVIGDFLDAGIYDTQSVWNATGFRGSSRNLLRFPPVPNPPPLRYWVGLNPIDILIDQNNPLAKARLIEGEEVWNGTFTSLVTDKISPIDPDDAPVGTANNGPAAQSASAPTGYVARQQIGNYLYVADATSGTLQVVNSNTFQVISTLDLPEPAGVAVRGDNRYVFTANAGDDTVSMIGADPTQVDFHQELARIPVGRGPKAISCQLSGEDVLVVNSIDDTVSIIELGTLTVRKTLDALIDGPREMVVTARQNGYGWNCGVYFAYIANFTGNNVVVYESGPDGPLGIGCNNVLGSLPTEDSDVQIFEPRGMCYTPYTNDQGLYAGGVFLAHRDNAGRGLVSHIQFTHQAFSGPLPCVLPPGQFFIPPGFNVREFAITGQWGLNSDSELIGSKPSSVVLSDFRYEDYSATPTGAASQDGRGTSGFGGLNSRHPIQFLPPTDPRAPHTATVEPDRMYVSFEDTDRIQVFDPVRIGVAIGELKEGTGYGVRRLISYYDSQ
ncbi:MAG: hypothetical protein EXS13_12495 [Planctomycetes bacterium]|nr:hypothetical protein [Planctomycetota bacterium]